MNIARNNMLPSFVFSLLGLVLIEPVLFKEIALEIWLPRTSFYH